ncbi:hypothetical protein F4779DRAFT_617908 [Xylariaceae sp. FL0662B]|nr:hypothetical protein F4779DRAFT_617908 [Xylariaceae sp. FL0662B]
MSNSTTFSYAQAAKGRAAAQPTGAQSNATQNQASSVTSTQNQDAAPTPSTRAPSIAVSTTSNEIDTSQSTRSSSVKPESSGFNHADADIKSAGDDASSPTKSTVEMLDLSDHAAERLSGEAGLQGAERQGRSVNSGTHIADSGDNKKNRKGKKGKASEKESDQDQDQDKKISPLSKPELSEAPIPAVNIWTQRREAQAAKTKSVQPTASQTRGSNNAAVSQPEGALSTTPQDSKQKPLQSNGIDTAAVHSRSLSSGVKAVKRDIEQPRGNGNQASRRNAPRGARAHDRADRPTFEPLTSVADGAASWPTPETAAIELKSHIQPERSEKSDKSEKEERDESMHSKPRQKEKWVPVPFVPTVNFQTPLPTRSSRGGRTGPPRGGRENVARSNHHAGAQGPTGIRRRTPRTLFRFANSPEGSNAASRATSVAPSASKRASVDMTTSRDVRKPQTQVEATKSPAEAVTASPKADVPNQAPADPAYGVGSQEPRSTGPGQRADDGAKVSESVKDNGYHGQNGGGYRNSHERTRGGTRARGSHSATNGVPHSQSQFAHGSGYNFPTNAAMRQPGNPWNSGYPQVPFNGSFPAQPTGSYHRGRPSSMSSRPQGNGRHVSGRMPSLPAINVPYNAGIYAPSNGQFYIDHHSILTLVLSQVEYYFSIDNLCKDWHLRKHMDSQGFVLLNVIASFKRMQELASDYGVIRLACESSPIIELVVGEDGQERVRRRDKWEPWVLELSERYPTAQNDGPGSWHPFSHVPHIDPLMMQSPYAVQSPPLFSPTGVDLNTAHYMNGMNGMYGSHMVSPTSNGVNGHVNHSESQLSATVPEFSPTGNPGIASSEDVTLLENGNNFGSANATKKANRSASLDIQIGSLPNGSDHKVNDVEHITQPGQPSTNGVSGNHGTEGY